MLQTTQMKLSNTKIALIASIGGLLFGFDTTVISGALSGIRTQFELSVHMEGWFVSSGLLGCIIGVLLTGIINDKVGRKKILVVAGLMFLLSAVGCAFATNFSLLVLFRLIGGVGVGMASVISPLYISELSPPAQRGRMISYYQLAITVGILLAYFSNAYINSLGNEVYSSSTARWLLQTENWRTMFFVMAIPSILFTVLIYRLPESPYWLALFQNQQIKVQGTAAVVSMKPAGDAGKSSSLFATKGVKLLLLIGSTLAILQQFSGINAIIYYGPVIFESAGISKDNSLNFQTFIGAVNLLFTFVAIKNVDSKGRKYLMQVGLIGMIIALILCGVIFHFNITNNYLLLSLILIYIACFALSVGPVTWILINEIFPSSIRSKAVSFCTLVLWIAVWIIGQFFPWLLRVAGAGPTFWVFAGFCIINLIFCKKMVKETRNKSLEEVEQMFIAPH